MFNNNKLIKLRKSYKLSQEQLAFKLNVSPSAIGMWEQGRRQPDNETVKKMAQLFSVSTDYLLDNDTTSNTIQDISSDDEELNEKLKRLAEDEFDRTLFKKYGDLTDEKKKIIMSVINGIIEEADKED